MEDQFAPLPKRDKIKTIGVVLSARTIIARGGPRSRDGNLLNASEEKALSQFGVSQTHSDAGMPISSQGEVPGGVGEIGRGKAVAIRISSPSTGRSSAERNHRILVRKDEAGSGPKVAMK